MHIHFINVAARDRLFRCLGVTCANIGICLGKKDDPDVIRHFGFNLPNRLFLLVLTVFLILQVLYFADTLAVYKSVYYAGTLLPLALMILGKFVRPPRAAPKAKKES